MSADNWTYCPKCQENARIKAAKAEAKLLESYGKIPINEYLKRMGEVNNPPKLEESFREDYEVGIIDGSLEISYRAWCNVCDFKWNHDESIPVI